MRMRFSSTPGAERASLACVRARSKPSRSKPSGELSALIPNGEIDILRRHRARERGGERAGLVDGVVGKLDQQILAHGVVLPHQFRRFLGRRRELGAPVGDFQNHRLESVQDG